MNHFVWLLMIATFILLINYLIFDTLYLRCLFKELTGYDCPACGAQRAVTSLFAGDFHSAFWYNPYLIILAPVLIVWAGVSLFKKNKGIQAKGVWHYVLLAVLASLMIVWTIVRNLPMWKDLVEAQLAL